MLAKATACTHHNAYWCATAMHSNPIVCVRVSNGELVLVTKQRVGDRVTAGDPIGAMADGGGTAYLYLEVRRGGDPVDPAPLLARANGG